MLERILECFNNSVFLTLCASVGNKKVSVIVYIRRAVDNVAVYGTDCYYMTGPSAYSNCVH